MSLDIHQLREHVVRPVLTRLGLHSLAAERLILGTGLHESRYQYLRQIGGPALGLWQMEGTTHLDLHRNFLLKHPELRRNVIRLASWFSGDFPEPSEMIGNINYACAMCRVHYRRVKAPLPAANDVRGLAQYAKDYYNTRYGKATVQQYQQAIEEVISQEAKP